MKNILNQEFQHFVEYQSNEVTIWKIQKIQFTLIGNFDSNEIDDNLQNEKTF
jgi:hypothetical protein